MCYLCRSSDSAKCGAGNSTAAVSRQWSACGGGAGAGAGGVRAWGGVRAGAAAGAAAGRPPAHPRISGSQRSLVSVASDSAAARRPRDPAPTHYPQHSSFSLFVSGRFAF